MEGLRTPKQESIIAEPVRTAIGAFNGTLKGIVQLISAPLLSRRLSAAPKSIRRTFSR
jgi:hypothetical protein